MKESDLTVRKKIGSDGRPLSFRRPDAVEQVVEDMQFNTRLPKAIEDIFISLAVRVVGDELYYTRLPEGVEKNINSLAVRVGKYGKKEKS